MAALSHTEHDGNHSMELHQIKTFLAVAREQNLSRAAEKLYISQPALSVHLKNLEAELGIRLFDRTSKGMALTRAGEALKLQAQHILESVDGLRREAQNLTGDITGQVRIGLHTDPVFLRTMEFCHHLRAEHPRLSPCLTHGVSRGLLDKTASGELDATFFFGDNRHESLETLELAELDMYFVVPAVWGDDLRDKEWEDLADVPWIWTPPECPFHHLSGDRLREHGREPGQVIIADNEQAIASLVVGGAGMSIMREDEARFYEESGQVAIWDKDKVRMRLCFAHPIKRNGDPLIQAVVDAVRAVWQV